MMEYVDSEGRVPRGMTEASNISMLRQAVLAKIIYDNGGTLVVEGFETPASVALMLDVEIAMRGLGNGRIELTLRPKPHAD